MKKKNQFGEQKPRYSLILNQYSDVRLSKCPNCQKLTHLRKFALLIHIDEGGLMTLGKTCRYCSKCELIMVHKDELEAELAHKFERLKPNVIGNDYFILGTVDKKFWEKGLEDKSLGFEELKKHTADIKEYMDLHVEPGGWFFEGEK